MSLLNILIKDAQEKRDAALNKFNNAYGKDIDITVEELNQAELRLNKLYELSKIGTI